jgi:lipid-A-disaccharide synthase
MHLFISAGEPSGDLHGANLVRALKERDPGVVVAGFGGERMTAAGAKLLYPLTDLAVMWIGRVLMHLPTFFRLAREAKEYFEREKPDAVVLIDYPGFHWHIAKRARAAGIPVYYFVPPQLWAWAGWRVKKMRANVDTVLTAMTFEDDWYRDRGVMTHYVGHPYFDDLAAQRLDANFMFNERRDPRRIVAILPGSRNQEVSGNLPLMLKAAERIHREHPGVRFLVAAFKESQASLIRDAVKPLALPITVHVGRTPEVIELAEACIAVSGSVSLEMLYRRKPAVIVYRGGLILRTLAKMMMTCKYITLVNLLADEELYPEFRTTRDDEPQVAECVLKWLKDSMVKAECVAKLTALRNRVAVPGACERAAELLLHKHGLKQKAA